MVISDAVLKAAKEKKCIYRTSVYQNDSDWYFKIKPTNSYECCQLISVTNFENSSRRARNWNPTLDDLVADDWEVMD